MTAKEYHFLLKKYGSTVTNNELYTSKSQIQLENYGMIIIDNSLSNDYHILYFFYNQYPEDIFTKTPKKYNDFKEFAKEVDLRKLLTYKTKLMEALNE